MKNESELCPCKSGEAYSNCCQQYHRGVLPSTALLLMRSRFSAYALGLADYIIETTHPGYTAYQKDRSQWITQIMHFSKNTIFENLEILEFEDSLETAYVTFKAHLKQHNRNASFIERSRFFKVGEKWLYVDGKTQAIE